MVEPRTRRYSPLPEVNLLANLLLFAGQGVGKSHLAAAIGRNAFGETVLGANLDVTAAYMAGVLGVVVAITMTILLVIAKVLKVSDAQSIPVRAAGGVIAMIGIYLLIGILHAD